MVCSLLAGDGPSDEAIQLSDGAVGDGECLHVVLWVFPMVVGHCACWTSKASHLVFMETMSCMIGE